MDVRTFWDVPASGLTKRAFAAAPSSKPLERERIREYLQAAIDEWSLPLPVYAIGFCTLFKTPDGSVRLGAAQIHEALITVCGPVGAQDPCITFMYKRGVANRRIEVGTPGADAGLLYDDYWVEDRPFQDIGSIEIQFTRATLPVFRIAFPYWKRGKYKDLCLRQARYIAEAIELCRDGFVPT